MIIPCGNKSPYVDDDEVIGVAMDCVKRLQQLIAEDKTGEWEDNTNRIYHLNAYQGMATEIQGWLDGIN